MLYDKNSLLLPFSIFYAQTSGKYSTHIDNSETLLSILTTQGLYQ